MTYKEIFGAAKYHHAIAISTQPRESQHSFTGYCVDVYFDDPQELVKCKKIIEYILNHFVAVSYTSDYAKVGIPYVVK